MEVPAVYNTVTERVLDQPARTEWKRGTGIGSGKGVSYGGAAATVERFGDLKVIETRVEDTGEVMCLVEIPASYKTIEKQMLVTPASTRVVEAACRVQDGREDRPEAARHHARNHHPG